MSSCEISPLRRALATVNAGGSARVLDGLTACGEEDARAIADALHQTRAVRDHGPGFSKVYTLCRLIQQTKDEPTRDALREHALPALARLFDRGGDDPADAWDLLNVLATIAAWGGPDLSGRIVDGSRRFPEGASWWLVFGHLSDHPTVAREVVETLRARFPKGDIAQAYLWTATRLCRKAIVLTHPFDSDAGYPHLREWLNGPDENLAQAVVVAIAYFGPGERESLLAQATVHPAIRVRMEATRLRATFGDPTAVPELIAWCDRPQTCWRAEKYLQELGAHDRIPMPRSPEFQALVEMAEWLEFPTELGRAPDELEVVDSRELFWPPTHDRRRVFALRYVVERSGPDDPDNRGQAMVGSVTFALFGEDTRHLSPVELYGLHCGWELQGNNDERAPAEVSVAAGLAVLRQYNSDLA